MFAARTKILDTHVDVQEAVILAGVRVGCNRMESRRRSEWDAK
jgi:hypothetical protein